MCFRVAVELASDIKGGIETEDIWEQNAEENIWAEGVRSDGRV
jgi:hypothetical protein